MLPFNLMGVRITGLSIAELNGLIEVAVTNGENWILANHNLHSLYLFHHDPKLREFFSHAKLAHVDGMSLIALGRLFGYPLSREQRVTYVDWIRPLMKKAAQENWKIFFLGSKPGVGEKASATLTDEFPGLQLMVRHGYLNCTPGSVEYEKLILDINSYRPHILMVGMGMPRQEHWILDNYTNITTNVILPVGACMDYVAGTVATPPRWFGRVGLEWLYRLVCEPKRLWTRYLLEPWFLGGLLLKELAQRLSGRIPPRDVDIEGL